MCLLALPLSCISSPRSNSMIGGRGLAGGELAQHRQPADLGSPPSNTGFDRLLVAVAGFCKKSENAYPQNLMRQRAHHRVGVQPCRVSSPLINFPISPLRDFAGTRFCFAVRWLTHHGCKSGAIGGGVTVARASRSIRGRSATSRHRLSSPPRLRFFPSSARRGLARRGLRARGGRCWWGV
jgi:hypothetical protein